MNLSEFLEQCKEKSYKRKDIKNFELATKLISPLKNKGRISGDTFFDHNLRVALILVKNRAMPEIVIAGLLHGDKESELKAKEKFGPEILFLLSGIDEVKRIKFQNKKLGVEALRRIILTTIEDTRDAMFFLINSQRFGTSKNLDYQSKKG